MLFPDLFQRIPLDFDGRNLIDIFAMILKEDAALEMIGDEITSFRIDDHGMWEF